jgi:hypothetical protein
MGNSVDEFWKILWSKSGVGFIIKFDDQLQNKFAGEVKGFNASPILKE